jgi:type IV pilus assembly protein PilW
MVGMVIGMLGIIVMMQLFSIFEGQKRTTTGSGDAQNNGAIALFELQREIQKSGYGISSFNLLGCDIQLRAGVTITSIAPVTINHASIPPGDANTDTLLVIYGNGNGSEDGDALNTSGSNYGVATPVSFAIGDHVVARLAPPATCNPIYLTTVINNVPNLTVAPGNMDPAPTATGVKDNMLYNLGSAPTIQAYAIRGGQLTVCKFIDIDPLTGADNGNDCSNVANTGNAAIWRPVASDIVSMQAIYEHDTATPIPAPIGQYYIVNTGDKTTPSVLNWPTASCGWLRTPAIGIALVARSGQYEKPNADGATVTTTAPTWGQSMPGGPFPPGNQFGINLTRNPDGSTNTNWGNYRYKVFQTEVPLRNVAWQGAQPGC